MLCTLQRLYCFILIDLRWGLLLLFLCGDEETNLEGNWIIYTRSHCAKHHVAWRRLTLEARLTAVAEHWLPARFFLWHPSAPSQGTFISINESHGSEGFWAKQESCNILDKRQSSEPTWRVPYQDTVQNASHSQISLSNLIILSSLMNLNPHRHGSLTPGSEQFQGPVSHL